MFKRLVLLVAIFITSGCASSQLNYNTLDIASTAADLQTQQVLFNLSQAKDNPFALPAQIDLGAGSASTNNSITPTIGAPFNAATGLVSTLTSTASATPSTMAQTQAMSSRAASTVSVIASDAWAQNWSYVPISNSNELRRLRALYAFALGYLSDRELIVEYPLVKKAQPITYTGVRPGTAGIYCPQMAFENPDRVHDAAEARLKVTTDKVDVARSSKDEQDALILRNTTESKAKRLKSLSADQTKDSRVQTAETEAQKAQTAYDNAKYRNRNNIDRLHADIAASGLANSETKASCNTVALQTQVPDEQFLREPSCVICLPTNYGVFSGDDRQLFVNPRLSALKGGWLLDESEQPSEASVRLGHFGRHQLFLRDRADQRKLSEFTLFVLTATEESAASVAAGGGGGSEKKSQPSVSAAFASSPAVLTTPFPSTQFVP